MKVTKLTNLLGLYLLAALVSLVLIGLYLIRPTLNEARQIKADAAKVKADVAALQKLDADTKILRENYDKIKNDRDKVLAQLPVSTEEERLLVLLNDLAQQSNVVLSTFRPDAINTPNSLVASLSIYPVTINATGTYTAIQTFLAKIENSARFVDIQTGVFTGSSQGSSVVAARINLQAYYQKEVIIPVTPTSVSQ